jgi:hypothetical protein
MALPTGMQFGSTDMEYDYAIAVTLDNTNDFGPPCRALFIHHTATATVVVKMQNGDNVTFAGIPANNGYILPIRACRVFVTGTTVTTVIALY